MRQKWLIGIDDTDNLESRGTGHRVRWLGDLLAREDLADIKGITRHQLLVDPRIPLHLTQQFNLYADQRRR